MCNFLSAIFTRDGRLFCQPQYTDSHSDLMAAYGIKERQTDAPVQQFVRLELIPPEPFVLDMAKWQETIDEHEVPAWFDNAKRFDAFEQMREIIINAVITDTRDMLLGGFYILADKALIREMRGSRVVMLGNSQVETMWENSQVKTMRGNSQVGTMRENSQVETMWGNSQVETMRGNSQVETMWENSQVETMRGNSQVGTMWENSQVGTMRGNSQVETMWGNSQVNIDLRDASNQAANAVRTPVKD